MATTIRRPRRRKSPFPLTVAKPNGLLHARVQRVGPEHFGILCVDCAKSSSVWMLADFYGNVLWPAATVTHARGDLEAALTALREVMGQHAITDAVAAVERTGTYHLPVKRALTRADWDVRIVHPYATKQFRQPVDPGNKTDLTDLLAIHRASVAGLGLMELPLDPPYRHLRLLVRHRRDLVEKATVLRCQIQEHLHAAMPGFAQLFDDLWDSRLPMVVARQVGSSQAVANLGEAGLTRLLDEQKVLYQRRSVAKVLAWSRTAPTPDEDACIHQQVYNTLDEDHSAQRERIHALERQAAQFLVGMPYILLLAIPGINVVSAADLAGEMGPISHYASASHITGRAGLFPSRYQSDKVDHADGPLVRCGNRRLRTALLSIADNLISCNDYFAAKARIWQAQGKDPRMARVKVAKTFSRISFQMVAGRQGFRHPCCQQRSYVLDKLMAFSRKRAIPADQLLVDLRAAVQQLPRRDHAAEAQPLQQWLGRTRTARTKEPQPLAEILPLVLAELGQAAVLQSGTSQNQDPG